MYLLACLSMVPGLILLKSTERLKCALTSQVYSYLKPLVRKTVYMEAVFLHILPWDNLFTSMKFRDY